VAVTVTLIGRDLKRLEQIFDDLIEDWGLGDAPGPGQTLAVSFQ
jgi:hypothetical protein